ncbi:MAG: hypothetical protein AAFQ13_01995, partial [Pseudomonadota bacterium]
ETLAPYVEDGTITSVLTIVGRYDPNIVYITAPLAKLKRRILSRGQPSPAPSASEPKVEPAE